MKNPLPLVIASEAKQSPDQ